MDNHSEMTPRDLSEPPRWNPTPAHPELPAEAVDIYLASLDPQAALVEKLESTLSDDERSRARRYLRARVGRRFVVARGTLRALLGAYLNADPAALRFEYNEHDKPSLAEEFRGAELCFNLSHSHDQALYAIVRGRDVGIDIERVRTDRDLQGIARRFFSPQETASLLRLPAAGRTLAFYRCWTRKEAYLKGKGGGLAFPLHAFQVSLAPDEPARLLESRLDSAGEDWFLEELLGGPQAVAALAVAGQAVELRRFRWS